MTHRTFQAFLELLIGDWVGHRRSTTLEQEPVRSQWHVALDGGFLHERWHTAGGEALPELTAEAFFRVSRHDEVTIRQPLVRTVTRSAP
jgi:hypothetical protein